MVGEPPPPQKKSKQVVCKNNFMAIIKKLVFQVERLGQSQHPGSQASRIALCAWHLENVKIAGNPTTTETSTSVNPWERVEVKQQQIEKQDKAKVQSQRHLEGTHHRHERGEEGVGQRERQASASASKEGKEVLG